MTFVNPLGTGWTRNTTLGTATPITVPSNAISSPLGDPKQGDLVIIFMAGNNAPTQVITPPAGWTQLGTQRNCSASIGGAAAVFYRAFQTGDTLGPVFTMGTVPAQWGAVCVVIRSASVAASSMTVTGDPSGAMTEELTVGAATYTQPKIPVAFDSDLRLIFFFSTGTTALPNKPSTPSAKNPAGQNYVAMPTSTFVSTAQYGGSFMQAPCDTDAGSTTWNEPSLNKLIAVPVVVSDGGVTSPVAQETEQYPVPQLLVVTGDEHITTLTIDSVTGRGGGGGISVF